MSSYSLLRWKKPSDKILVPSIDISASMHQSNSKVVFTYQIKGAISQILLAELSESGRADGLWEETCFESFLSVPGSSRYTEFNFSPNGQWNAYQFSAYREGMKILTIDVPVIEVIKRDDYYQLTALFKQGIWDLVLGNSNELEINLTAVIKSRVNHLYYYSLRPVADIAPDFHHRKGFIQYPINSLVHRNDHDE